VRRTLHTGKLVDAIKAGVNTKAQLIKKFDVAPEFMAHVLKTLRRMGRISFFAGKWRVAS
jgi:hypothetical protein